MWFNSEMKILPASITENLQKQIPDLVPFLLPDDELANVQYINIIKQQSLPSAIKALKQLTRVRHFSEIGLRGPSLAATKHIENHAIPELSLYEALFARDAIRVALDLLPIFPRLAISTSLKLASLQGIRNSKTSEEEPGKIIHEDRPSTDAIRKIIRKEQGWGWPYYGSIDSTPSFLLLLTRLCAQEGVETMLKTYTGKDKQEHNLVHAFEKSLNWLLQKLNESPLGLLEYKRQNPLGIGNQVWKDSFDSYFHKDGTIANFDNGIASVEVQALAYDALLESQSLCQILETNKLLSHREALNYYGQINVRAPLLKEQTLASFWSITGSQNFFVIGLEKGTSGYSQLEIKTSNMGHLLNSSLLENKNLRKYVEQTVNVLMSKEMLNASGIRTLSNKEKLFKPGAYHNGSVWLWDTYYIAQGLLRHGYRQEGLDLICRICDVVKTHHSFPEFASGANGSIPLLNSRIVDVWNTRTQTMNRVEQPPQEIQAWSVSAMLAAKYRKEIS